jgi:hypothetical protein
MAKRALEPNPGALEGWLALQNSSNFTDGRHRYY